MEASPRIGEKKDYTKLPVIGQVPSLINYPVGCTFYDRCPIHEESCRLSFPPLLENGGVPSDEPADESAGRHTVACFVANRKKGLI